MPTPVAVLHNRTFRRHRYIEGAGWVVSQDTFKCRLQPKFNDAIQRTRQPEVMDPFLNVIVFRDNPNPISSYVDTSYSFSDLAEATAAAQSGVGLAIGDRLFEEGSAYGLVVRSVSHLRDAWLKHDEITCSELSQLDQKWIEPITITEVTVPENAVYYDPIRHQFVKLEPNEMNEVEAFGVIEPFDLSRFDRDIKVLDRTEVGKEFNDRLLVSIDADFPVTENTTLKLRGKYFKVEYIRDSLSRILVLGVSAFDQRGLGGDEFRSRPNRQISIQ